MSSDDGFSLVETLAAMGVLFGALLALAQLALVGFREIAVARQRQVASQLAGRIVEQVRGLPPDVVEMGLATIDLSGDPAVHECADGLYLDACPEGDPSAEPIVHSEAAPLTVPLFPHRGTVGPPTYTRPYEWSVYITRAADVPAAGGLRVTTKVAWTTSPGTGGRPMEVELQT